VLSALVYYKDITDPYTPVKKEEQEKTMITAAPVEKTPVPEEKNQAAPIPVHESKGEQEADKEPPKKRRKWPWVLFILLFLLAA
ncbi:hypothetical protein KXT90_25090, partial [Salmonella enterica subsp. enterica serovar Weltevreden]|nr:hypothetical protein [Salmonella enterica subsp. enterica serovar Weltevreden]MCH5988346.1 hypothetical protein [Salmonella enterica]